MQEMIDFLAKMAFYLAPMYFANSSAMLLKGNAQLDFGIKLHDGNPLFGKGKTIRGTVGGIAVGTTVGLVLGYIFSAQAYSFFPQYATLSFMLAAGAIFGDLVGSFLKRRMGVRSGTEAPFLDQLDFVAGGILLSMTVYAPAFIEVIFVVVLTLIVHKLSNEIAYKLELKKVPW